jgi:dipeptidyl aminopeptidase/acylaminoacyl peptidase
MTPAPNGIRVVTAQVTLVLAILAPSALTGQAPVLHEEAYLSPPSEIAEAVTAPRHEDERPVNPSPDGRLLLHELRHAPLLLADLSRPFQRLGGLEVDTYAQRDRSLWVRGSAGYVVTSWSDGSRVTLEAPAGARVGGARWSPDGSRLAYMVHYGEESHVYVAVPTEGTAHRVTRTPLLATRVTDVEWSGDGAHMFVVVRPEGQGPPPSAPAEPVSPLVRVTSPDENRLRTFPSLLRDPHERALAEYYSTGQVVRIDVTGPEPRPEPVGEPAMVQALSVAPDGNHLRVSTTRTPLPYIVPVRLGGETDQVWDLDGRTLVELDRIDPRLGVDDDEEDPTERRDVRWRPDGAGLSFLQQVPSPEDEENGEGDGEERDRVMLWRPPFDEASLEVVYETEGRIRELHYSPDASILFLIRREEEVERLEAVYLDAPEVVHTLYEWDTEDWYANPGTLVTAPNAQGVEAVRISDDGRTVHLSGTRYSETPLEEAPRPFLDRVEIRTGERERVFESSPQVHEAVDAVLDDEAAHLLLRRESPTQVPDSWILIRDSGELVRLTENADHTPDLTATRREILEVIRPDGVTFQVRVTLPPDYQEGDRRPAMLWFYPREYQDQESYDESNRTYNRNAFPSVAPRSLEILARRGYVVVHNDHPIIGPRERWNDSYTVDLRANLLTVIDEVDARGWIDRRRVALGGHSYGGFGTINAMVQTPFFRAGIAGAPNSNRLLTPLGFQFERRALWDARETYLEMSPFLWAERLSGALLIYHGEDDQNVGTFPDNSWRLIHALNGLGKTAALYMYPHEGHGPAAQETLLDMWARWVAWLDHYVRDADPSEPVRPVVAEEEEGAGEGR